MLLLVIPKGQIQTQTRVLTKHIPVIRNMVPINITTRGIESYKHIGILSGKSGKVLPLYGRQTYTGSNRWNYYTRGNDHLSLKIPLTKNGRDCDDNNGCNELYDNDLIFLPEFSDDFTVKLYNSTPRYIPFL